MHGIDVTQSGGTGLYDRLNSRWHERALQLFMLIVLGHWAEHLAQAVQIYALGWPRPQAGGVLGLWYPWLVGSEVLHYGYAVNNGNGFTIDRENPKYVFRGEEKPAELARLLLQALDELKALTR